MQVFRSQKPRLHADYMGCITDHLTQTSCARCKGCSQEKPFVVGRSRKQKVELGGSAVTERLQVDGRTLSYQQLEGSFSQPNAGAALQKVNVCLKQVGHSVSHASSC